MILFKTAALLGDAAKGTLISCVYFGFTGPLRFADTMIAYLGELKSSSSVHPNRSKISDVDNLNCDLRMEITSSDSLDCTNSTYRSFTFLHKSL